MSARGWFGVGIEGNKTPSNLGTLWRSAQAFGADFCFTVGARYPDRHQPSDTTKANLHVPLWSFETLGDLNDAFPVHGALIGIETGGDREMGAFAHPERAVYLLGAEDHGLSEEARGMCKWLVSIPSRYCLNVAVAGSIAIYDRERYMSTGDGQNFGVGDA